MMEVLRNIELKNYNSFRTKAIAKLFFQFHSVDELLQVLHQYPNEKKLILGNGYNLFFTKDYDGLVIKPAIKGISIISETQSTIDIEVGAAEDWDHFVEYCVINGFAGIENLSLIPGSVGAAPIQNIGAYGAEVKDVIKLVKTVDTKTHELKNFENEACEFAYRTSIFKKTKRYIITSVIFRLQKEFVYREKYADLNQELKDFISPTLSQVRNAVIQVRTRKLPDPEILPNAGSFFKNPILNDDEKNKLLQKNPHAPIFKIKDEEYKTSAAYLIEQTGYKGKRRGKVGTYKNHALIIVNHGTEDGNEIASFVEEIQKAVHKQFEIYLEPEVWIF